MRGDLGFGPSWLTSSASALVGVPDEGSARTEASPPRAPGLRARSPQPRSKLRMHGFLTEAPPGEDQPTAHATTARTCRQATRLPGLGVRPRRTANGVGRYQCSAKAFPPRAVPRSVIPIRSTSCARPRRRRRRVPQEQAHADARSRGRTALPMHNPWFNSVFLLVRGRHLRLPPPRTTKGGKAMTTGATRPPCREPTSQRRKWRALNARAGPLSRVPTWIQGLSRISSGSEE